MVKFLKFVWCFLLLFLCNVTKAQLVNFDTGVNMSLRGLAVHNNKIVMASGQGNTVLRTEDGGNTWSKMLVGDTALHLDFRSIVLLNENTSVIANAGHPAQLFKTTDAGKNWKLVYEDTSLTAFVDGMAFWDSNNGIALADPSNGKWNLLRTIDGGSTWYKLENTPIAQEKEAAFAASGSSIAVFRKKQVVFVTGGADAARVYFSNNAGETWDMRYTLLPANASSGLFSVTKNSAGALVAVGGDYLNQADSLANIVILENRAFNKISLLPNNLPRGYRCSVSYVAKGTLIASGDKGIDISIDNGFNWRPFSDLGFYTSRCFEGTCWFSGSKGRIANAKIH